MNSRMILGFVCVAVLVTGAFAMAAEGGLKTTASAGVTLTDGNSETMQANASIVSEGEKEGLGSVRFGVEANYGETTVSNQTDTTVENVKVFGNVKKTLSEKTFVYLDASVLYDDIALIDYRAMIGPGLGLYLVKTEVTKLSIELGAAYVWEDVANIGDDYVALRAAGRLDHQLSETAKIWQSAEYLPQADDFDNHLINAELGVEAALNATMNLRLVLQDKYDSRPAAGLDRNDLTLIAGISVKL